jgi:hypothetical protein
VIVVGLVFLTKDLATDQKQDVFRYAATGRVVRVKKLPAGQYHCFLSHSHKHGADQVASIKYKLEKMIEGCQCFLDVDSLRLIGSGSLSQLPAIISDSVTLLIFRKSPAQLYLLASSLNV